MLGVSVNSFKESNTRDFEPDEDDRGHSRQKGCCFMCYHENDKKKRPTRKVSVQCKKPVCVEHSYTQTKCQNCYME